MKYNLLLEKELKIQHVDH